MSTADLAQVYIRACDLELRALKPGNVHVHAPGHGMEVDDFHRSARASARFLVAADLPLGQRIYQAVAATRSACGCNTNLGIALLSAPLLQAATRTRQHRGLRLALEQVLRDADVGDSEWINRAIRLAAPAGLGHVPRHDVSGPATAPVREIMAEASPRDSVARQFAHAYADLFDFAVPRWRELRARWHSEEWATTGVYLGLLARLPDSHVARKHGIERARKLTARAVAWEAQLLQSGAPGATFAALMAADQELKNSAINPGTTADLTVASILIVFVEELLGTSGPRVALDAAAYQ